MDRFLAQYLILSQTVRSLCLHVHKLAHYYHNNNNNNSGGGGGGHLLHAATYRIPKAAGGQSIGYQRFRLMKYFVLLVLEVDDAILRNESISLRIGNIGELILSISMCVCVCIIFAFPYRQGQACGPVWISVPRTNVHVVFPSQDPERFIYRACPRSALAAFW